MTAFAKIIGISLKISLFCVAVNYAFSTIGIDLIEKMNIILFLIVLFPAFAGYESIIAWLGESKNDKKTNTTHEQL